jgi:hypothetical protein
MKTPYLVVRHDHGATKRNTGGGSIKGLFYLEANNIEEELRKLISDRDWATGYSYSVSPIGLVIDHP